LTPPAFPDIETVTLENGKSVIALRVPGGGGLYTYQDGIQVMKDYMASGSFSRGRDVINANAAMVFVGNLNQSVESLVKTGYLSGTASRGRNREILRVRIRSRRQDQGSHQDRV